MKHQAAQHGLNWTVDSAGTGHWHVGGLPDARSIAKAQQYGIDIRGQRARQFHVFDFERFDRIFVMDAQNFRDVQRLAEHEEHRSKVELILNQSYPGQNRSVPDPYYDSDEGFENVFRMLDEACALFIKNTLDART